MGSRSVAKPCAVELRRGHPSARRGVSKLPPSRSGRTVRQLTLQAEVHLLVEEYPRRSGSEPPPVRDSFGIPRTRVPPLGVRNRQLSVWIVGVGLGRPVSFVSLRLLPTTRNVKAMRNGLTMPEQFN